MLPDPLYVNVSARPITLVTASMDSNSLFHDLTKVRVAGCTLQGQPTGQGRSGGRGGGNWEGCRGRWRVRAAKGDGPWGKRCWGSWVSQGATASIADGESAFDD